MYYWKIFLEHQIGIYFWNIPRKEFNIPTCLTSVNFNFGHLFIVGIILAKFRLYIFWAYEKKMYFSKSFLENQIFFFWNIPYKGFNIPTCPCSSWALFWLKFNLKLFGYLKKKKKNLLKSVHRRKKIGTFLIRRLTFLPEFD